MTGTLPCNDYNDDQSGSKTDSEKAIRTTYQLPSKVIRPKTKVQFQVTRKEIWHLKATTIPAINNRVQDNIRVAAPGTTLKNRQRRKSLKDRSKRYSGKPLKKVVLLFYIAGLVQNAKCSTHTPTAEVDTNPVVFGANVILKCKFKTDIVKDIHWLKGSNKNYLTDGNSSLCPAEYSTRLYQERGEYIYFLIIQKFVIANVDSYICEFGFNQGEITLTLNENMTYVPVDDDISIEISNAQALESSAVDIHVHVNRIYPKPNCTVAYKDVEISNTVNISVNNTSKLYMVNIDVKSVDCYGVFYIDCSISSSHFNKSEVIDLCRSGETIQIKIIAVISTIVGLAILTCMVILLIMLRRRSRGISTQKRKNSYSSVAQH